MNPENLQYVHMSNAEPTRIEADGPERHLAGRIELGRSWLEIVTSSSRLGPRLEICMIRRGVSRPPFSIAIDAPEIPAFLAAIRAAADALEPPPPLRAKYTPPVDKLHGRGIPRGRTSPVSK